MAEEEFEIMPRKQISELKKEINSLKKTGSSSSTNVKDSMNQLTVDLGEMIKIFKEATESMKLDEEEERLMASKIGPINEKLDTLIDQNKKIAEGIIAVADMIDEKFPRGYKREQRKEENKEPEEDTSFPPKLEPRPQMPDHPMPPARTAPEPMAPPRTAQMPPPRMQPEQPYFQQSPPKSPMPFPQSKPAEMPRGLGNLPEPPSAAPPPPRRKGFLDRFK